MHKSQIKQKLFNISNWTSSWSSEEVIENI